MAGHPIFHVVAQADPAIGKALRTPMSQPARSLLGECLQYVLNHALLVEGPGDAVRKFIAVADLCLFEQAAISFSSPELIKLIKRIPKSKKWDAAMAQATLKHLWDGEWENDYPNNIKPYATKTVFDDRMREIYRFLTRSFLVDDFSSGELGKFVDMARQSTLEEVQEACRGIPEMDKHSISFLAYSMRHDDAVRAAIANKTDKEFLEGIQRIAHTMQVASTPVDQRVRKPYDPNWAADVDADIALDQDTKK